MPLFAVTFPQEPYNLMQNCSPRGCRAREWDSSGSTPLSLCTTLIEQKLCRLYNN